MSAPPLPHAKGNQMLQLDGTGHVGAPAPSAPRPCSPRDPASFWEWCMPKLHFPQRGPASTSKLSVLGITGVAHHPITDELSLRLNSMLHELLMIIQASSSPLCPHPVSYQISRCLFLWKWRHWLEDTLSMQHFPCPKCLQTTPNPSNL